MAEKTIHERELEAAKVGHYTGAKWDSDRDIADIAKLLRKDIKAAIKAGYLPDAKYSVTISRYSMGRSLSVTVINADYLTINPKRVAWDDSFPHRNHFDLPDDVVTWKSEKARETEAALESMAKVYNFDKSVLIEDYHHSGFHFTVNHDHEKEGADRELVRSELSEHPHWLESLKGVA